MAKGKLGTYKGDETGRNDPKKSEITTTGSYKKAETYKKQAAEHKDPGQVGQHANVPPRTEGDAGLTLKADSRALEVLGEKRSGSDSAAHSGRKRSRLHEDHRDRNTPERPTEDVASVEHDPHVDNLAGET